MDKFRIGKWLIGTTDGNAFVAKQYILQGLNPTLESKIFNPLSTLGLVGASQAWEVVKTAIGDIRGLPNQTINIGEFAEGFAQFAASALFQIGHTERHKGGGRYEDVVPLGKKLPDFILNMLPSGMDTVLSPIDFSKENTGFGSRIAMQSNPEVIKQTTIDFGWGIKISFGGKDLPTSMMMMNPNKYLFPISSAPKSIDKGVPSFTGTTDVLRSDVRKIENQKGGTFNKNTNQYNVDDDGLIKRHSTLAYDRLIGDFGYITDSGKRIFSAGEVNEYINTGDKPAGSKSRFENSKIVAGIGKQGQPSLTDPKEDGDMGVKTGLGVIKGSTVSPNVDKINILPVVRGLGDELPNSIESNPDFIKFRIRDVVNNKYLVFRAILSGITDTVTPEYNPIEYIGRPDKLYTYKGVGREIAFNFKLYPKTKQEFPALMEKMNYLVGLCYPSYTTENERMVSPFVELTLGDLFDNAPGLFGSVTVTVEDASTWEIQEGLQYPHFISVGCNFTYIGKHIPVTTGKHYDLPWLNSGDNHDGAQPVGAAPNDGSTVTYDRVENKVWMNRPAGYTE
jgi:hypothetical protein